MSVIEEKNEKIVEKNEKTNAINNNSIQTRVRQILTNVKDGKDEDIAELEDVKKAMDLVKGHTRDVEEQENNKEDR